MTIKTILKIVCDFVGESEIISKLDDMKNLSKAEKEKVDKMVRCFNLINQEIACDYIPTTMKEDIDAVNILNFSSLKQKNVFRVLELKNRLGCKMKFKQYNGHIEFCGRAKTVLYSYLPADIEIDQEFQTDIPPYLFAYGVASEYLLIDGVSEDADIWQEKYKQALFMQTKSRGEHILPKRNWL